MVCGNGIIGKYSSYLFEKPKIVIGRVGAKCGNVHITSPKSWITDNALLVKEVPSEFDLDFLYLQLKNSNLRQFAKQSAQPVISKGTINDVELIVPSLSKQKDIVKSYKKFKKNLESLTSSQILMKEKILQLKSSILNHYLDPNTYSD
ncbi:MAG: restriction endonuclease subunit S [Nitrosopumilus sp.]|uniref:restriction endonuclease subunit S n=1 Tax=Nitrosopumilus sp. TaxID=2024843 RepID=UPI00246F401C|nr:restriction endonuclease subunit S [Nitrosopumilus sp.]MDH5431744.1 restriction endonuclease subunit S [Nitrosopumilus sp.]